MNSGSIYIRPAIKFYSSFDEALSANEDWDKYLLSKEDKWEFGTLFNHARTAVVAEPGYGKTRLLREMVLHAKEQGYRGIAVELKKISGRSLEKFIFEQSRVPSTLKSQSFRLKDAKNVVVCLDALDEVKLDEFSLVVEKLKIFLAKYVKIRVIISCRWHFFCKYKNLFSDFEFRFVRIFPFSTLQVRSYLKRNHIEEEALEKIVSILSVRGRDLVIQTPRYLELIVNYIGDKGTEKIQELTKADLFEFFIYKKLEIEDKNLNTQKRYMIQRVLEQLALIMEIFQANLISKDELMSFFDEINSDLKSSLLQQVQLEVFYEKTVLKDNIDSIEFDNTEFQEYLAAKELLRLGESSSVIYELAVDPELREIYPSWFNTLGFVVDMDISNLMPILDFGQRGTMGRIQDEEYHRFLTQVNVTRLPVRERKTIFRQIFTYYQSVLHWIGWDIAKSLSYYFDLSQNDMLKGYVDGRRFKADDIKRLVYSANVATIVGFLFQRGIFPNRERVYWRDKLIKFANDKNENGVLQRRSLHALKLLHDDSVIKRVQRAWNNADKLIREAFLTLCAEVNPNHTLSLKYFVEDIKQGSIDGIYGLCNIRETKAIKRLLKYFLDDQEFLDKFIDMEGSFESDVPRFVERMEMIWDNDVNNKLQKIILNAYRSKKWYGAKKSQFVRNIAFVLRRKNKQYVLKLDSTKFS